jgi:hypothetical protein
MMRRAGQQVKSLPVIHVISAFLDLNMTRLSQSRRLLSLAMSAKYYAIRCRCPRSVKVFGERPSITNRGGRAESGVTRPQQNAGKWRITYI